MTEEAEKKRPQTVKETPPDPCPYCGYTCSRASLMSRHMNSKHSDLKKNPAQALVKILDGKDSIPDMLHATAHWLDNASSLEGHLPADMVEWLRKEDAKVQLALRVIAVVKVHRVMQLISYVADADTLFGEKFKDEKWRKDASVHDIKRMADSLSESMAQELKFLKEISTLGQVNVSDVVDKLVQAFGATALTKSAGKVTAFELRGLTLPADPAEREVFRNILGSLDLTGLVKDDKRSRPVEQADGRPEKESTQDS